MKINTALPFISCDCPYDLADIILFGAPFDGTTSFRPGTRFGPHAIRAASEDGIETYSPYQNKDLEDLQICDIGDLAFPFGSTEAVLNIIENTVNIIAADKKTPVMLGGEHLVSLGAVRALSSVYPDLHIVHLDAHADLRDDYLGVSLSHATVMRRIWEIVGDDKIFQYGIRSGDKAEFDWAKKHVSTRKFNCNGIDQALAQTSGKPVYLTIDLDVLDPSVFPGTGTPEAGGIMFPELIDTITQIGNAQIIGADLNELSPHYDTSGISTAAACNALRELLLSIAPI